MKQILITAGTTTLTLKLKSILTKSFNVLLGYSEEIPFLSSDKYLKLPKESSNSFVHEFLKACLDKEIQYLLPIYKEEILLLSENIPLFKEYGITILIPPPIVLKDLAMVQEIENYDDLQLLEEGYDHLLNKTTDLKITGLGTRSNSRHNFTLVAY